MSSGDWVEYRDVKDEIHKDIRPAVAKLVERGWRLRRMGHKFRAFCPCGKDGTGARIDGTVGNEKKHATRLLRNAELCPDRHELIK